MSLPPILANSTRTCKGYKPQCIAHTEEGLLYAGLALIAVGVAGNLVSFEPFLSQQRESTVDSPYHRGARENSHLIINLLVSIVGVFGKTIPYIRPWTLRFGIPAVCTVLSTLWFIIGWSGYNMAPRDPNGSPLCTLCRVFVSAAFKMFRPYPPDDTLGYHGIDRVNFSKTSCLRALHKAAVIEEDGNNIKRWKLCSVQEVEDAKLVVRMVPLWMTFLVCGIISSTGDTYFVEQAGKLDRHIGKLKLPVEVLLLARMILSDILNTRAIQPSFRSRKRRSNIAFYWMTFAMLCSVLCCISAAGTERMRLNAVTRNGLLDKANEAIPMSMYWLLFQFALLGGLDTILLSANEYYAVPPGYNGDERSRQMKAYLESFGVAMFGLGFMSSSLFVYVVGRISEMGGRPNWFQQTLNKSRLDRYYWVLAALSSVNLVVFFVIRWRYRYKNNKDRRRTELEETDGRDSIESSCCCFET